MGAGQVLDDLPPHAAHLLAAAFARRSRGAAHVLLGDPAAGTARRDGVEVDAELLRDAADERRRLDRPSRSPGRAGAWD